MIGSHREGKKNTEDCYCVLTHDVFEQGKKFGEVGGAVPRYDKKN